MMHKTLCTLFITLCYCVVPSYGQQAPREQAAEVLQTWVRAAAAVTTVRTRSTDTYEQWKGDLFVAHLIGRNEQLVSPSGFAARGQSVDIELGKSKPGEIRGFLRNKDYEARITSPDGVIWRLAEISEGGQPQKEGVAGHDFLYDVDGRLEWLQQDSYISFYRILNDPRFRAIRVDATINGGRRFYFTMEHNVPIPLPNKILTKLIIQYHAKLRGGWFEVSGPACRIDAYDVESVNAQQKPFHEIGYLEYFTDANLPAPFIKKFTIEKPAYEKRDGTIVRTRVIKECEVESLATNVDEREFYLSHYGLPEPFGTTPPKTPTRTYLWLLIAGGGFVLLSLLCRWLLVRRAKKLLLALLPPSG